MGDSSKNPPRACASASPSEETALATPTPCLFFLVFFIYIIYLYIIYILKNLPPAPLPSHSYINE